MIVVDANILIYAYRSEAAEYAAARTWLERAFSGSEPVRIPWPAVNAFLRLMTKQSLFARPLTIEEAVAIVDEWFTTPAVAVVEPGPQYWPIFREVTRATQATGNLIPDAEIAALTIEHDATLYTADSDFRRFAGLRVVNPLT